jgi:hypothetical protein
MDLFTVNVMIENVEKKASKCKFYVIFATSIQKKSYSN